MEQMTLGELIDSHKIEGPYVLYVMDGGDLADIRKVTTNTYGFDAKAKQFTICCDNGTNLPATRETLIMLEPL